MPTIGETLREARMRQRLDIADVERDTKIRAKYLRALENEEFSMLPGPTFVKTFLRTYAELLGLDPHALVEQYRADHEPRDELETLKPLGPTGVGRRDRRRRGPRPWMVAALLAAAVVIGLVVLGMSVDEDPERRRHDHHHRDHGAHGAHGDAAEGEARAPASAWSCGSPRAHRRTCAWTRGAEPR